MLFQDSADCRAPPANTQQEVCALLNAGNMLARAGRFEESHGCFQDALQRADQLNDELLRYEAFDALRAVSGHMGERTDGLPHHLRALGLWQAAQNRLGEAITLKRIGMSYYWGSRDLVRAAAALQQALALQSALDNRSGMAKTLEEIAKVHAEAGRIDDALAACSSALELHRANGDRRGQAAALSNRGIFLMRLGRFGEALDSLENARKILQQVGDVGAVAWATTMIVDVYFRLDQREQGLREARHGAALVSSLRNAIREPKWQAGLLEQHRLEELIIEELMRLYHEGCADDILS